MLLSLAILTLIRAIAKARVTRVNFTLMNLVALLTLMSVWCHKTLNHVAIKVASFIMVEGNQLPDANTVASLAIFLNSFGVTQML